MQTPGKVVWLPYASAEEAEQRLGGIPDGLYVDCYRADGGNWPDTVADVEFYVLPYMKGEEVLDRVGEMSRLKVIQTLTAGVENFLPFVPDGVTLCNAAGVHDASTAELAIALALASGRYLDHYARNQPSGIWEGLELGISLADQRVLIIGYGNIGAAIERRLAGFEVASVTRVARRPRTEPVEVHPTEESSGAAAAGRRRHSGGTAYAPDRGDDRQQRACRDAGWGFVGQCRPGQTC